MPGHTGVIQRGECVAGILGNFLEIHDAGIIEVLSWEKSEIKLGGMDIRERVVMSIPTAEAEVETTDCGKMSVYNDNLGAWLIRMTVHQLYMVFTFS